jgi:hypothetical protein
MNIPGFDNQNFSEKTLKGILLQNVDRKSKDPMVIKLNQFLIERVDIFWDQIVIPLKYKNKFNPNKITWYFNIYKEALEARKVKNNPFNKINITVEQIVDLVNFYNEKTIDQYIELGTSFLANTLSILTSWLRDQTILMRLETVYNSSDPVQWILQAEAEERGIMSKKPDGLPELETVIKNISFIMSRRV